jgi:uncharacterized membrane protein
MKAIQFTDSNAQRIYNDYISRCKKSISILSAADQEDCLMEINSYIYEYLESRKSANEIDELLNILDRLGTPEETLREMVASKKTQQAIKSFNPKHLVQSLVLNIGKGIFYTILSVLFLFSVTFLILSVLKIFFYNSVGCYAGENDFSFGFTDSKPGVREVLGFWFIPITFLTGLFLYYLIIILLKIKNKKRL